MQTTFSGRAQQCIAGAPAHGSSPRGVPFRSGPAFKSLPVRPSVSRDAPELTRSAGSARTASRAARLVTRASNPTPGKYDYILVGGGTAACVLANRLTADGTKSVLVLEAGGPHGSMDVRLPAGLPRLFKSMLDWNLYSVKQHPVDDRQVYMARGKLLGGSSCTNATLYHRGTASDYDSWGVRGWGSKEALELMIANEDNAAGAVQGVHGAGGLMHVEQPRYQNRLHDLFFESCRANGLPANPDFNDWTRPQAGYGEFQVFHDRGERADMYRQYMQPALGRPNLTVLTNAKTLKVVLEGKTARGVTYVIGGPDGESREAELASGGEVIMCAGAVHTPQILQLSGVGPAAELKRVGIDVVADLPGVGQNLQDHPAALTAFKTKESLGAIALTDQLLRASGKVRTRAMLAWALFRKGPLTTTGCDHGAFVSTTGSGDPDLQIRFVPGLALNPDGIGSYVDFGRRPAGSKWPSGFTFQLLAVRPKSRGSISLRSADPFDAPLFDPGFISNPADLATLRAGVRLSREIAAQPALAEVTECEFHPGTAVSSDEDVDAYIRRTLHSGNAVVGSCKMGNPGAAGAVVDPELRVVGVNGLRVVDASVIPVIPGGQTGAAVVMIAERAARILTAGREQQQVPVTQIPAVPALA